MDLTFKTPILVLTFVPNGVIIYTTKGKNKEDDTMKRITHSESLYILKNAEGIAYAYTDDINEVMEYIDKATACGMKRKVEYAGGITYYTFYED